MKKRKFRSLTILITAVFLSSCGDSGYVALPVERSLTNTAGKKIDVTIIGKSEKTITFINKADGRKHTYLISKLSSKDRFFVKLLPLVEPAKSGLMSQDISYIGNREAAIADFKRKKKEAEMASLTLSGGKFRAKLKEMSRCDTEIKKLQKAIAEYQSNN